MEQSGIHIYKEEGKPDYVRFKDVMENLSLLAVIYKIMESEKEKAIE